MALKSLLRRMAERHQRMIDAEKQVDAAVASLNAINRMVMSTVIRTQTDLDERRYR